MDDINYLFLTHHHDDHSGFAKKLLAYTDIKIIADHHAGELLKKGENDKSRGGGYINKRMYYLSKLYKLFNPDWDLTFPPLELEKNDILIDGDNDKVLRDIGIEGKILYTPGHTIDSISLLLDNGIIFCGDAAMSWPLWAGIKYCPIFVTNVDILYDSWQKIIKSSAKKIYPSHGEPFNIEKLRKNIGEYNNNSLVEFF